MRLLSISYSFLCFFNLKKLDKIKTIPVYLHRNFLLAFPQRIKLSRDGERTGFMTHRQPV